jgi:hypothetical protein
MYIFKIGLVGPIVSLKCYSCANFGRINNDLTLSDSCSNPSSLDQAAFNCSGLYCYVKKTFNIINFFFQIKVGFFLSYSDVKETIS